MTDPSGGPNAQDDWRSAPPPGQWPPTGQDGTMPYQQPYEPSYPPQPQNAYPGYGYPPPGYPPQRPNNPLGVAGFVCGLCGVVLFWVPFLGLALGITGTSLSGLGMGHGRRTGAGSGLAIAGLVLGIFATLVGALVVISLVTGNYN